MEDKTGLRHMSNKCHKAGRSFRPKMLAWWKHLINLNS